MSGAPALHLYKAEALVVATAGVGAAALEAGNGAAEWSDALVIAAALGAAVAVTDALAAAREGEIVAALFIDEAEIAACLTPFRAVGLDAPAAGAGAGDEVGELVAEGFVHFFDAELDQARVHSHETLGVIRLAGGGAKAWMPENLYALGEGAAADVAQELPGLWVEVGEARGFAGLCGRLRFFSEGGDEAL